MSICARVRARVQLLGRTAFRWQCDQCSKWFESDAPSQTCPDCG